jgi:3-methyladenine DNA glycosylase Mpg
MDCIHSNGWVQKQTNVEVIAGPTKAALALGVTREVKFRRILNCKHVPPIRTKASDPCSCRKHFTVADRIMVKEATEGELLVTIIRQPMNARSRLPAHRIEQIRTDAPKTRIAKAP